MIILVRYVFIF